jgi:alkylation response protein AidB-like acyl-CoA dehydrogenase
MASGEKVWCQLFSEPAAGSDLAGLRTRAERDGEDWVINGQKIWTSAAHFSDYAILLARTDATVPKHRGLTMFFLSMNSPGLEVRPIRQANGMYEFNEVFFTNVRIPDSQRLGGVNDGWSVSLTTLMNERQAVGPGNPIPVTEVVKFFCELETPAGRAIDNPAVRSKLADWAVRASGLKYTQYRSMTALSRNETPGPEESIGKLVAASTLQEMATCVLEQQGQAGVLASPEHAAANAYYQMILLRAAGTRIEGGSDEILRNIIGERVLGLPPDIRVDKNVPFNTIPTSAQRR